MSHAIPAPAFPSDAGEFRWHYLYRTAALAALITVALFLFQIVAFFVWPPPSTVIRRHWSGYRAYGNNVYTHEFLPNWEPIAWNEDCLHELAGLLWYWVHGWI